VLLPVFDPDFSDHSYGFRPGRSAHHAVLAARDYVAEGRRWVVEMDLEKFFDRVNHGVLMSRVARKVKDRAVLRLIRRYLTAGILCGGVVEVPRRGHAFCRYADDCYTYVYSRRAGERLLTSLERYLDEAVRRLKGKMKMETRRGRGQSLATTLAHLRPLLRGWFTYFRLAEVKNVFEELDGWLRRRLRCILWKQWKRGTWWNAGAQHMHLAFPKRYFDRLGSGVLIVVEPPYTEPYVRWCERTAGVTPPPTRFL